MKFVPTEARGEAAEVTAPMRPTEPKILVFESEASEGGGLDSIQQAIEDKLLRARILAVLSDVEHGKVQAAAKRLRFDFWCRESWTGTWYRKLAVLGTWGDDIPPLCLFIAWKHPIRELPERAPVVITTNPGPLVFRYPEERKLTPLGLTLSRKLGGLRRRRLQRKPPPWAAP